eukprot:g15323.t1
MRFTRCGVTATIGGQEVRVGTSRFLSQGPFLLYKSVMAVFFMSWAIYWREAGATVVLAKRVGGGELSGEFQEYGCLSLAVSCMVLNHDGSLLFVGGEDGVLAMYCVADDPKAAEKKARERDAVEYMEEILVTKTDIKIQSKQMQGLKNAVDELMLNNEYQLRLKDMNYKEKMVRIHPHVENVDT